MVKVSKDMPHNCQFTVLWEAGGKLWSYAMSHKHGTTYRYSEDQDEWLPDSFPMNAVNMEAITIIGYIRLENDDD